MKSRLTRISNWAVLARAAGYRTNGLARLCGVSPRELERFFLGRTGKTPHQRLNELRQIDAASMISAGKSVKETALEPGYKHPAHFSRDFKQFHGQPPTSAQSTTSPPSLTDMVHPATHAVTPRYDPGRRTTKCFVSFVSLV